MSYWGGVPGRIQDLSTLGGSCKSGIIRKLLGISRIPDVPLGITISGRILLVKHVSCKYCQDPRTCRLL